MADIIAKGGCTHNNNRIKIKSKKLFNHDEIYFTCDYNIPNDYELGEGCGAGLILNGKIVYEFYGDLDRVFSYFII